MSYTSIHNIIIIYVFNICYQKISYFVFIFVPLSLCITMLCRFTTIVCKYNIFKYLDLELSIPYRITGIFCVQISNTCTKNIIYSYFNVWKIPEICLFIFLNSKLMFCIKNIKSLANIIYLQYYITARFLEKKYCILNGSK